MRVQDYKGNEIKVGTKVIYGSPGPNEIAVHTAEVIDISEPDISSHDDEYGREIVSGYLVYITIKFDNGDTDELRASLAVSGPYDQEAEEIFEESGDLEVVV